MAHSGKTVPAKMTGTSAEKVGLVQRLAAPVRDSISAFQRTGGAVTAGVEPCTRALAGTITRGAAFSASPPHPMHEGRFLKAINGNTDSSMTRDGTRFLRIQQVEPERAITHIDLVLNWFAEVKSHTVGN